MFRYDPVGYVAGRSDRTYRKQPIGAVAEDEIRGVVLVDPDTGAVLRDPEPAQGPIVP